MKNYNQSHDWFGFGADLRFFSRKPRVSLYFLAKRELIEPENKG
jgi:hypothetical protein